MATLEDHDTDLKREVEEGSLPTEPTEVQSTQPAAAAQVETDDAQSKKVEDVLNSDIGVNVILERFKQTIISMREVNGVLKKRAVLEEDRAAALRKLSRSTVDDISRQDGRQGTFARQFSEVLKVNESMSANGMQYALSLTQMHDDLNELCNRMEKSRKLWKQNGLNPEKKFQDAKVLAEKAKMKYDTLAEEYDRAKTGDKTSSRGFGFKKSGQQYEDDLLKKLQTADSDYSSKVQVAETLRQELVTTLRPNALKSIHELIEECDAALTLQLQKYVAFNEKQLLGDGILVTPINTTGDGPEAMHHLSLSQIVSAIDNHKDFKDHIAAQAANIRQTGEIKYEKHHTLAPQQSAPTHRQTPSVNQNEGQPPPPQQQQTYQQQQQQPSQPPPQASHPQSTPPPQAYQAYNGGGGYQGPPQLPHPVPQYQQQQYPPNPPIYPGANMSSPYQANEPPSRQVFGISLDELFNRDGSPVPMVVYQCVQAVDLFGLDVEGIYRVPGNQMHIHSIRQMFDTNFESVDFRNPEAFSHDVNSVAGLLKQFFRDLPDPLLTSEHYDDLIQAARIDDDVMRRDSLHAIINNLPDPNYATLRTLVLHLHRVSQHSNANRMSTSNLAICFAPTLMGQHRGPMADAALQARVIDTILQNTLQIFDDD